MLDKTKVIITGGTSGIGKAIACLFAKNGADVAIFGTNSNKANQALNEISNVKKDSNQEVIAKLVDIANFEETKKAIEDILNKWQRVDVLINNAGITKDNLLLRMTEEDWDRVIDVNLKSVYNTSKTLIKPMLKARKGKIINISSVVALMGNPGQVNYTASKAGIIGFTKSLAKEVAAKGIYVNGIAPGFIQTAMTDSLPEKVKEEMLNNVPMKRFGNPEEIAKVALFLASDLSSYVNGQILTVDGGMVM